jgi:hypothetical protein
MPVLMERYHDTAYEVLKKAILYLHTGLQYHFGL